MDKLILDLCKQYHIKVISNTQISIITSYKSELEDIETTYDSLKLIQTHNSASGSTVQGVFKFTN